MQFKIGDRVKAIADRKVIGEIGTIKGFHGRGAGDCDCYHVLVEFDNNICGHDGEVHRPGHCWYLFNTEVELLERPKITIKPYGIVKFLEGIKA